MLEPVVVCLLLLSGSSLAITLNTSNTTSITNAAKTIADSIMNIYSGNELGETPGLFPRPYYFWESGLAWDSLINYWAQTGDDTYNDVVNAALSWQVGPENNYLPPNQTQSMGNDDQSFWALAAMTAAEQGFPAPAGSLVGGSNVTWIQLAKNVFDTQALRWDEETCNGGLRWQIYSFNAGYTYKNALSTGNFYQLASRLALYTGNSTYSDWADRALSWTAQSGLLSNETGAVFDGFDTTTNCIMTNHIQWTANTGTYLSGAAYLQNYSSILSNVAAARALFISNEGTFTQDNVLYEVACEPNGVCNTDQLAFKAIISRALARTRDLTVLTSRTTTMVNGTIVGTLQERMDSIIRASAQGAAAQCSGGDTGSVCGSSWINNTWDGSQGLGQDLSALEIILATLPSKEIRNANSSASSASVNSTTSNITNSGTGPSDIPLANTNSASNMSSSVMSLLLVVSLTLLGFAI